MNKDKKYKIAIFTECFYPGTGGAEKAVECLADSFVGLGHPVMVCAPKYWDCDERGTYITNRTKSLKVGKNSFLPLPKFSKDFKKKLDEFKPDIIHCNANNSMLGFAIKYAKKNKIPVVYTAHTKLKMYVETITHSKFIAKVFCKWVGKKIKKCDLVTSVSKSMDAEFKAYGYNGEFSVIKNGCTYKKIEITDDLKNLAKERYCLKDNENVFLFVGHVEKCKNIDFIFNALNLLYEKNKDFKMFFVGSADYKKFLKKVKKSQLSNNIIFTNQITDRNLLSSLYANSKIFLFPSIFDNDSLAIIESAVHKVPSMVLKNTGSAERIIDGQNGFVVSDEQDMANRLEYLINNPEEIKIVGKRAAEDLPKNWEESAKEYLKLFDNLVK